MSLGDGASQNQRPLAPLPLRVTRGGGEAVVLRDQLQVHAKQMAAGACMMANRG